MKILLQLVRSLNPQWVIVISFSFLTIFWIAIRLPTLEMALMDTDSGHQLAAAVQILHGEHPYVNFDATYGPLVFYASALAQILFGQNYMAELILRALGYTVAYVFLALIIYRMTRKPILVFLFGGLALLAMPQLFKYYVVAGPILTIWFACYYIDNPVKRNTFWLALAVTATGLFRPDFGVYCMIAATAAVVLQPFYTSNALKRIFIFWLEIFLAALPWLLFLAFKGRLGNYFFDTLDAAPNFAMGLSLPFPIFQFSQPLFSLDNIYFFATVFFFALPYTFLLFLVLRWKHIDESQRKILLTATLLYALLLIQASIRTGVSRLEQAVPLSFLLTAWIVNRLWGKITAPAFKKISVVYWFVLLLLCAGVSTPVFLMSRSLSPEINVHGIREKIRQYSLPKDEILSSASAGKSVWYIETMQYIRRCTGDQQRLMALPILTTFYYYTDRSFGGGQLGIYPGYLVTPKDRQRIITKMKQEDIPLIVYWPNFVLDRIPERKMETVAPEVVSYIQANYHLVKKEAPIDLMLRNDLTIKEQAGSLDKFSCPVLLH